MGLLLSFQFRGRMPFREAERIVWRLHRFARRLPFDEVTPVIRLEESCDGGLSATHFRGSGPGDAIEIPPVEAVWFNVDTDGAETATFGLGSRPATVEVDGTPVPSGLEGLCTWQGCCKTQYASLPQYGGEENFLRAHLGLVAVLDEARRLGLDVEVGDDGGYWSRRDPDALLEELRRWNRHVAGLARMLIDHFGDEFGPLVAPILSHPDFERLVAEGG